MYSRIRASGLANGCPYQPSTTWGPETPRPRISRPPERWSSVIAAIAVAAGVRAEIWTIAVPSLIRSVRGAPPGERHQRVGAVRLGRPHRIEPQPLGLLDRLGGPGRRPAAPSSPCSAQAAVLAPSRANPTRWCASGASSARRSRLGERGCVASHSSRVGRRPARRAPQHAIAVRVAAPARVALRGDQHVLGQRRQVAPAQRAAVCRGLAVLGAAQRPPPRPRKLLFSHVARIASARAEPLSSPDRGAAAKRIVAETERYRITGLLRLPPDGYRSRLSDYLNAPERSFLPLTDVELEPLDGGAETSSSTVPGAVAEPHRVRDAARRANATKASRQCAPPASARRLRGPSRGIVKRWQRVRQTSLRD